jgi:hypothetical protein
MFDTLDETNFILYAAKYYENTSNAGEIEFEDDLSRIRYIKRLFAKYKERNDLNERLILNHLIVLYNVFHHKACTRMLVYKLVGYHHYLKPFLIYLSYWPEKIEAVGINKEVVNVHDIPLDEYIVHKLRKL